MSYREAVTTVSTTCPNIHVEPAYDGWVWIFSNGDLVATYNHDSGELDILKEGA